VNTKVQEPPAWQRADKGDKQRGSLRALFGDSRWAKPAILGMLLAAVGLGTFWSVVVAGQDLTRELLFRRLAADHRLVATPAGAQPTKESLLAQGVPKTEIAEAEGSAKFAYGIVQTAGGGLGLLAFGPLADWWGRKRAFAAMHIAALGIVPITCYLPQTYGQMLAILPVFGFFTLGIHAGYAVYFPELFPNHLRATGSGFCFNGGRLFSAVFLLLSGVLKDQPNVDLRLAVTLLSSLFVGGLVLLVFLPETKGRALPE
jgi:MFS family permease